MLSQVGMLIEDRKIETRYKFEYSIELSNSKLDITFCISAQAVTQAAETGHLVSAQMARRGVMACPACPINRDAAAKARCQLETLAVRAAPPPPPPAWRRFTGTCQEPEHGRTGDVRGCAR